ncbi:hypothetical protein DFQ28_008209 [Apophysomyces sp. BC1034]|nr:hypothetical protein DFQ30_007701 [Apophysomyces sp. BC1015]KAG0192702.1 hypothetical protein DFQ28_008209 [Apophysomyces sp. BC1034]
MPISVESAVHSTDDKPTSRKRKQECSNNNSGFVNPSPPSSPLLCHHTMDPLTDTISFNFDSAFPALDQPTEFAATTLANSFCHVPTSLDAHMHYPHTGPASRRHSVAVAELDHHSSFTGVKQEFDIPTWDTELQQLLGSSWTSSSSMNNETYHHRRRTLSSVPQMPTSPTGSLFFSPSFLKSLNTDDDKDTHTLPMDLSENTPSSFPGGMSHPNSNQALQTLQDDMMPLLGHSSNLITTTITPSAISNDSQSIATWLMDPHTAVRRRHSSQSGSPFPHSPSSNTVSSSSPSPPITPMQSCTFDSLQATIPEEEDEGEEPQGPWSNNNNNNNKHLTDARMLQGIHSASKLQPLIQQYLLSEDSVHAGERTVMILTSRVAQKSYGTEKRFLCPPPTTMLMGSSWWTKPTLNDHFKPANLAAPKLTIHISGEATNQTGVLEWYTSSGSILDCSASNHATIMTDNNIMGKCVSKQLHINDADEKRKRVEVLVNFQLGNGLQFGTLASKSIKVISKPSKKRQSIKNIELCIHHGTTISLFNRIRSQTVSTKYLGVFNGQNSSTAKGSSNTGTCFVARTGSWDPFVIWIVDISRVPDTNTSRVNSANPHFPPPPAIALQTTSTHPVAIHYNQPVVLQCVSTGLVSPVMVIRKIDKGSMALGGNHVDSMAGGECGDESLGDPVSQLHKIAFQIVQDPSIAQSNYHRHSGPSMMMPNQDWMLPQSYQPATYLACLNDIIGMYRTTGPRTLVSTRRNTGTPSTSAAAAAAAAADQTMPPMSPWTDQLNNNFMPSDLISVVSQDGKVIRKRRVSCDVAKQMSLLPRVSAMSKHRRRVNSLNDVSIDQRRRGSVSDRRGSTSSNCSEPSQTDGACWTEDVSDAAVWTIVGTDCATYTFWTPPHQDEFNAAFGDAAYPSSPIAPFPTVSQLCAAGGGTANATMMTVSGDNLSRDLAVWFGDVRSRHTEYKSHESLLCSIPDIHELMNSPTVMLESDGMRRKVPLLLVRGDGVVYRTGTFYSF